MSIKLEFCSNLVRSTWRVVDPKLGFPYLFCYSVPFVCSGIGLVNPSLLYDVGYPLSFSALYLYDLGVCWKLGTVHYPGATLALLMFGHSLRQLCLTFSRQKSQGYLANVAKFFPEEEQSFFRKFYNWQQVALTCFVHNALPYLFISQAERFDLLSISGLSLIAIAAIVQAIADQQKISHKQEHGDTFCETGLYSLCRHPNYLAQIVLTLGIVVTCSSSVKCLPKLAFMAFPHIMFMYQMFSVTKGMAKMQAKKYLSDSQYTAYTERVKKLIPCVW